jgi:NADH-quinone oxidoreductase subunit A
MLNSYGPIVIFFVIAAAFPIVTLWVMKFIRPKFNATPEKVMPYECGITPESDARGRYTVRFYIVAILFVIFDVETVFLFPWAVQYQTLGLFGWSR